MTCFMVGFGAGMALMLAIATWQARADYAAWREMFDRQQEIIAELERAAQSRE